MAEPLDVAARLAEGHPAVDNIGDYVWACHLLGYQDPDLTLHAAQVRDWYSSEDGLDLRALEADRAALAAAAAAAESARHLQQQQIGVLAAAWQGRGGHASHEFLVRHGRASEAAASAVRNAVDALRTLRDDLWHAVDEKVAAAVAIDDRRQAERPEWLAATHTVTTGAGDRVNASELIDQQVKPFVDNDIRLDWLTAMQRAMAAVSAAFGAATAAVTGASAGSFEVSGDLGPASVPTMSAGGPADVAGTAPAAWSSPSPAAAAPPAGPMPTSSPVFPAAPEPPAAPSVAAPPPPVAPAASAPTAMPPMPSLPSPGELASGLPGAAGGLAGLGSQLADAIGGFVDRPDDAAADPPEFEPEALDDEEPVPDDEEEEPEDTEELAAAEEPAAEPDATCAEEPADEAPPEDPVPTQPPAPMPPPPPPIVEPPPSAEPLGAETPCEIAADELPQAGP